MAPPKAKIASIGHPTAEGSGGTTVASASTMTARRSGRVPSERKHFIDVHTENLRTRSKRTTRKPKAQPEAVKAMAKKKPGRKPKSAKIQELLEESEAEDQQRSDQEAEEEEEEAPAPPPKPAQGKRRGAKQAGPPPKRQRFAEPKGKKTITGKSKQAANVGKKRGRANDEEEEGSTPVVKPAAKKRKTPAKTTNKSSTKAASKANKRQSNLDRRSDEGEELDADPGLSFLPEYDPDQVTNGQTEENQVKYNASISADIPNVTIPLGSKFRIEPAEIERTASGEFACSCPAFRKSSRMIKTCKHLFLFNGHQYEQKRYNDALSRAAPEGCSTLDDISSEHGEKGTPTTGDQPTGNQGDETQKQQSPKPFPSSSEDQSNTTADETKVD
ncbi:hypothetical protein TWF694_008862 [Orbilia ellipsospora]|uniref:SWIM-type domain-containing protein n=1 Tax=Orbilia ellipsospora TaxID=2528407 RepID=A0AAV9XE55_9PEZI